MTEPTTDRPTDTIRDAFEAMLEFFVYLLTSTSASAKGTPGRIGANAASALRLFDSSDSDLLALSDLIQRAAEEHNRRAAAGGDFTPERIREARERCERATPGPWVHSPPGVDEPHVSTKIGSDGERVNWLASPRSAPSKRWHDAAFIAHAREDLPAALTWGEQQAREIEALRANLQSVLGSACRRAEELARERDSKAAEIERLKAGLAARARADASLEARAKHAAQVYDDACVAPDDNADEQAWLAVVRAVDASRPWLTERDADDIELARAIRDTLREVTHAGAIERLEELLDVEKEAAARPGLTEEQIETLAKSFDAKAEAEMVLSRKNREEPAEWRHEAVSVAWDEAAALLRASRGETGPAPTGLTSAMHAAQQRRSVPPASAFGEWPDEPRGGLTCPGCYDATGIAQPHDPRATLHAGDPASPFAPGSLAAGSATEDRILDRKRGGK